MQVQQDSAHRLEHDGEAYLFCSAHCLAKFRADPEAFASPEQETQETDTETETEPMSLRATQILIERGRFVFSDHRASQVEGLAAHGRPPSFADLHVVDAQL